MLLMRKITCLGEGNELFIKEEWKVVFLMRKITCLGEGNELCQNKRVESCVPDA